MAVSGRRVISTSRVLLFFVFLTFGAIIAQTWLSIMEDKALTLATERENSLVAVRLLEEHASQTLHDAERNLNNFADLVLAADTERDIDEVAVSQLVADEKLNGRLPSVVEFIGTKAGILVPSTSYSAIDSNFAQRPHIRFLMQYRLYKQTIIGNAFKRNNNGELAIPLAQNIHDKEGRLLGVISTDVSVSNFSKVYERIASGGNALVALFADEGAVLVRFPYNERFWQLNVAQSPVLKQLKGKEAEGYFEDQHFLSNGEAIPRMYAYRKIEGFAATAVFARTLDTVLVDWRARTIDHILYAGVFIGIHLILTYFLAIHINRLHESESSLYDNIGRLHQTETLLRTSETKFVAMFQYSPAPLSVMRLRDRRILEVNDSLLKQFGFDREQFMAQTTLPLWNNDAERVAYLESLAHQHSVPHFEVQMRHRDGHVLFCLLSARVFELDGEETAIFSPIDVTREREIEQEIRELNTQLEERVKRRTDKLEMSNAELANALTTLKNAQVELLHSEKMAALGSLVAGVAHELNTPIGNSVTVSSTVEEWILKMDEELKAPKPRRALLSAAVTACLSGTEILRRNLERAAELVTSFKQVAVDQSSNQRRKFDLRQAIEEVLLTLRPMYAKTAFRLEYDLAPKIDMDSFPGALGQIITNFVSNALAHAFEGRTTGLMQITSSLKDGQAEIVFSDDGVGISEQNMKRVFDPFFTTKLGKGGYGLGMHIVYNLITDVLGGKVVLTSTVGVGTQLTVTLPLLAPQALAAPIENTVQVVA